VRLICLYQLIKQRKVFIALLRQRLIDTEYSEDVEQRALLLYQQLLHDARQHGAWGGEYHILAMVKMFYHIKVW
jgi:hypothetical protein